MSEHKQSKSPSIDELVQEVLSVATDPIGPLQILKLLAAKGYVVERAGVNRVLYALATAQKAKKIQESPPLWIWGTVVEAKKKDLVTAPPTATLMVCIDLGNVHDSVTPIEAMRELEPGTEIFAYAPKAYSSPEIKRALKHIKLWSCPFETKSSVSVKIIRDVSKAPASVKQFIIASKSSDFQALQEQLQAEGFRCDIVSGWEELKLYLA